MADGPINTEQSIPTERKNGLVDWLKSLFKKKKPPSPPPPPESTNDNTGFIWS